MFPDERSTEYVQTEWCEDWEDIAAGFGYAAEHVTRHRRDFHQSIDQAGTAVFFLQRHRVELLLKALLDAADMPPEEVAGIGHSLTKLWEACGAKLGENRYWKREWERFAEEHHELIMALHKADESSFSFRYPIDRKGQRVSRPPFINLDVLNRHVEEFDFAVQDFTDELRQMPAEEY